MQAVERVVVSVLEPLRLPSLLCSKVASGVTLSAGVASFLVLGGRLQRGCAGRRAQIRQFCGSWCSVACEPCATIGPEPCQPSNWVVGEGLWGHSGDSANPNFSQMTYRWQGFERRFDWSPISLERKPTCDTLRAFFTLLFSQALLHGTMGGLVLSGAGVKYKDPFD